MQQVLPLEKMTTAEKIQAMEQIWDDLCRKPEEVQSPAWHQEILTQREQRIESGEAKFIKWDDAKQSIRNETR